jgi:hypothetical protein
VVVGQVLCHPFQAHQFNTLAEEVEVLIHHQAEKFKHGQVAVVELGV